MQDFAAYLVSQCEKKKSGTRLLVEELTELWGASQSHTYKKMRGQTPISLAEALAAARKYQFSLDEFVFGQSDTVLVRYPTIGQPPKTPHRFLGELLHTMRAMRQAKPDLRIRYATNEIPIFYYLLFPELTAFKMYLWSRSVWKSLDGRLSSKNWIAALLADAEFQALSAETFDTFASIPTDEYYPLNMLDNTLKQIDFLCAIGQISPEFADVLRQQLLSLTKLDGPYSRRRNQAGFSRKPGRGLRTAPQRDALYQQHRSDRQARRRIAFLYFRQSQLPHHRRCTDGGLHRRVV